MCKVPEVPADSILVRDTFILDLCLCVDDNSVILKLVAPSEVTFYLLK